MLKVNFNPLSGKFDYTEVADGGSGTLPGGNSTTVWFYQTSEFQMIRMSFDAWAPFEPYNSSFDMTAVYVADDNRTDHAIYNKVVPESAGSGVTYSFFQLGSNFFFQLTNNLSEDLEYKYTIEVIK